MNIGVSEKIGVCLLTLVELLKAVLSVNCVIQTTVSTQKILGQEEVGYTEARRYVMLKQKINTLVG